MSGPDLERRYRRLLAWYPWPHRREYEDEMLAVLVASARPGQRRRTFGEATNLVGSGLRVRGRAAVGGLATPSTWLITTATVHIVRSRSGHRIRHRKSLT